MTERSDVLDILLGHVEVQRRGGEARIVAHDRHGNQTVYADWCSPVQMVEPEPKKRRWWQRATPSDSSHA